MSPIHKIFHDAYYQSRNIAPNNNHFVGAACDPSAGNYGLPISAALRVAIDAAYRHGLEVGKTTKVARVNETLINEARQQGRAEAFAVPNHPLIRAFREAVEQVTTGKGEARHGRGAKSFFDQPWLKLAKVHGIGFLTGQAAKKLDEAQAMRHARDDGTTDDLDGKWRKEMLGVLVYSAMSLLYDDIQEGKIELSGQQVVGGKCELGKDRNEPCRCWSIVAPPVPSSTDSDCLS